MSKDVNKHLGVSAAHLLFSNLKKNYNHLRRDTSSKGILNIHVSLIKEGSDDKIFHLLITYFFLYEYIFYKTSLFLSPYNHILGHKYI